MKADDEEGERTSDTMLNIPAIYSLTRHNLDHIRIFASFLDALN
jgi:hypothetical protein